MVKQPGDDECAPLTSRLAELLSVRGYGWSYDEIGKLCGLKGVTVRAYLRQARLLLGCETEAEAIAEATRLGIIDLNVPAPEHSPWNRRRP